MLFLLAQGMTGLTNPITMISGKTVDVGVPALLVPNVALFGEWCRQLNILFIRQLRLYTSIRNGVYNRWNGLLKDVTHLIFSLSGLVINLFDFLAMLSHHLELLLSAFLPTFSLLSLTNDLG